MEKTNYAEENIRLQKKLEHLESELERTKLQLTRCLGVPAQREMKQSSEQNELFSRYKLCEANWSEIPESNHHARNDAKKISAFKMLNTPVTFEMFDRYCVATGQQPPGDNGWGRENRPVINVNYQDALTYTRWLSEQTGWHCRIPTEAQWEYACRADTYTDYWYGSVPDPRMMVMGTGKTMPTPGSRLANPWDLYDMHGNVWEWTATTKGDEYILCGGSWYNKANWLTSSARNISYPNFSHNNWGFRIIRK